MLGGMIFISALLVDFVIGKKFSLGWGQIILLGSGVLCFLLGWLFKQGHQSAFYMVIFTALMGIFGFLKLQIFNLDSFRVWNDLASYVETAIIPVTQLEFWTGIRPFVLPLLYRLFGINLSNYGDGAWMSRFLLFQFIFSYLVWSFFIYTIYRIIKNGFMKILSMSIMVLLGLGLHYSFWDKLLLSESISNSLFVLLVALLLFMFTLDVTTHRKWKITCMILLLISSIFYIFIRDANVYLVLAGSSFGLCCWLLTKKGKPRQGLLIATSLAGIAISLAAIVLMNSTQRWWAPLQDVLIYRRDPQPELAEYFADKGIDISASNPFFAVDTAFVNDPDTLQEKAEMLKDAKKVYVGFLVSHPAYAFTAPLPDFPGMLSPVNLEYRYSFKVTGTWITALTNFIYPQGGWIYPAGLLCCVFCFFINHRKFEPGVLVAGFLILVIFPLVLLIWHSDTMELERHAEQFMIQSRMGFWLAALLLADTMIAKIGRKA